MVVLIPLLVALAGLLVYALVQNQKIAELGRIAFFCGLLVTVLTLSGQVVRLLPS